MHMLVLKNHVSISETRFKNTLLFLGIGAMERRRNDRVQHTYMWAVWSTHARVHVTNMVLQSPVEECLWALPTNLFGSYCWLGMPFESNLPPRDPSHYQGLVKTTSWPSPYSPTVECEVGSLLSSTTSS